MESFDHAPPVAVPVSGPPVHEANAPAMDRVRGLDSVRFLCALWVFFGHGASPTLWNPFASDSFAGRALRGVYGNLWIGSAAVIVFFVISGFCIHFPFAGSDQRPKLREFYARRFVRILVPVIAAVPLSALLNVRLTLFQDSILWSLVAELIYYAFYPAFRAAQLHRGSWNGMIVLSFVVALAVAATDRSAGNYPSYGPGLNWLLGLPCWLLGCALAESVRTGAASRVSTASMWAWRAAVFGAAWGCSFVRYHSPVGFPWTLNFFALFVVCWLRREIDFRRRVAPSRGLEWAGLSSYSLYLMHIPASAMFERLFPSFAEGNMRWACLVVFVLVTCYAFYLLFERPSHALAKVIAEKLRPVRPAVVSSGAV